MSELFTLHVYLKQPKDKKQPQYPIYIRITLNGERAEICTKRESEPAKWNRKAKRMIGTSEKVRLVNAYLDTLISKIYAYHNKLLQSKLPVTAESIKNKFTGKGDKGRMLVAIFKQHNKEMEALVGSEFAEATLTRYETTLDHVINFMKWKYGITDIDIKSLNQEFVADLNFYFRAEKKCNNNTTVKYISNLKKIIGICVDNRWLDRDPFIAFKQKVKVVDRIFLNEAEMHVLENKEFTIERISQVRDLFVFCCYTGYAYVDLKKLTPHNLVIGIDGRYWIHKNRKKTETASNIPLLPKAMAIIEKYKSHPACINNGVLLPVISNQKMNAYLKEIADLCRIEKTLTVHVARHTFATTITLNNDVPIESVSKMLGHYNCNYAYMLYIKTFSTFAMVTTIVK